MIKFSNNLRTTLAADVTNVATTISVTSVATFPTLNTGDTLYLTLSDLSETVSEIVICTAISGTDLTVLRAQEGTTAQTWTAANEIRVTGRLTAGLLDSLRNSLVPVGGTIDNLGDVNTSTAVDGQILTWNSAAGEWQAQDFVVDNVGSTNNVDVRSYNSTQGQTSFAVIYDGTKSTVEVFVNGIKIADTEYTATSGNSVVFNTGRNADDIIDLIGYSGAAIAISTLEDVDTSNLSPVDGQSLVWNNTSGVWERGTAAGTAVGLIDGIVKGDGLGTISAAVADVDYLAATPNMAAFRDAFTFPTVDSTSGYVLATDGNGNLSFVVQSGGGGVSGTISTVDMHSYIAVSSQTSFAVAYDSTDSTVDVYVNGVKIAASEYTATSGINIVFNTGRTAGDVVDVVGYSKAAVSIDNLTDVDTTTSAPTNQQVLGWSTVNGQWEPLTVVVNETDPVFTAWDKSTGISITESQISDFGSYLTTVALNDVSNVTLTTPTSGEVLKYDGSNWVNSTNTGGISLTDLSVTTNAAGTAALSYNNTTGEFSYTPPDLSSYSTFDGAYSSLTGTPTIPTVLTDLGITDGSANQVLTTDGNGTFSFQNASGGTTINSIDDINDVDTTTTAPDNGQALVWDGTNWVPGTVAASETGTSLASDIRSYTLTEDQDTFSVNYDVATESVTVFLNGIKLDPSTYTATTGTSITLNTTAVTGDIVDIVGYIKGIFAGGTNTRTATGDGTTTIYQVTAGASVDDVFVMLNGIVQTPTSDYTISGTDLTFTTAPANGDLIQIREVATLATGSGSSGASTGVAIAMAIVFGG